MNQRQYETTFIVDAHLPGDRIDAAVDKYSAFIDKNGGKVQRVDRWGKRRLAYEIAKKQYGYYVNIRFESEGNFIIELEKTYKLDDTIIRYLTTLMPPAALKEEREKAEEKAEEKAAASAEPEKVKAPSEGDKAEPVKAGVDTAEIKAETEVKDKPVEEEKGETSSKAGEEKAPE